MPNKMDYKKLIYETECLFDAKILYETSGVYLIMSDFHGEVAYLLYHMSLN